jgi:photosynthesis system II assembly factor YCF48-like protein
MEKLMGPDERDRKFDKALSRHLRSVAPSREAAQSSADAAFEGVSCLDLETLAAYHERSLLAAEMNFCKEHIVGCAHCQSILAQLEATEGIPLRAAEEEEILARKGSQSLLVAQTNEAFPAAAGPSQSLRETAAPSKPSREIRHFPGPRWKWLAPAGALAAGLLVWVALHENQPLTLPKANEVKVATNEPPVSPSPSVPTGAIQGTPAPQSQTALTKQQAAAEEIASSRAPAASGGADLRQRSFQYQARVSPSKPLAGKEGEGRDQESAARKDAGREVSADALTAATQADLDAKAAPETAQEKVELQAQQQVVTLPSQNQNAANLQQQNQNVYESSNLHGPAAMGQATASKKIKPSSAPPAPAPPVPAPATPTSASAGGVSAFSAVPSVQKAMISNQRLITVPGSKVVWRVGRSGLIEFSSDSGASWSPQTSGALADLVTGYALSDRICWIVGRAGTVLLTTDGGAHWKLLSSPMPDDLGGIQASDGLHARVWNSLNTKSFETSDGGVTWKRFVNE